MWLFTRRAVSHEGMLLCCMMGSVEPNVLTYITGLKVKISLTLCCTDFPCNFSVYKHHDVLRAQNYLLSLTV